MTRKNLYGGFILGLLLTCFAAVPVFMTPIQGINIQTFYQRMDPALYEAMEWAKNNTSTNATFVTEAYYGWWFAGFAQRPTWSAVDPQYLSLGRELPIAKVASSLLDTDYQLEAVFTLDKKNATMQVREDGGYLARHNPEILTKLNWTYFPFSFFNFNSNETTIRFLLNDVRSSVSLDELKVKDMRMENDTQRVTVSITRGNQYFDVLQSTTINQGSKFVNMTTRIVTHTEDISLLWLDMTIEASALPVGSERSNTLGFLSSGVKAFGQIVFNQKNPNVTVNSEEKLGSTKVALSYPLDDRSPNEIALSATTYSVSDDPANFATALTIQNFFDKQIEANLQPETPSSNPLPTPFNYQAELKINKLNYIVIPKYYELASEADMKLKFVNDPSFSLVFINNEVAIFEVKQ